VVSRFITRWRERVWQYATRVLEAGSEEERAALLHEVQGKTLKLGNLIRLRD
jgi:hypothetical protein